jgi:hypothetical protein
MIFSIMTLSIMTFSIIINKTTEMEVLYINIFWVKSNTDKTLLHNVFTRFSWFF